MRVRALLVALLVMVVTSCVLAEPLARRASRPVVRTTTRVTPAWWNTSPGQIQTVKGYVVRIGNDFVTLNLSQGAQAFAVVAKTEIFVEGKRADLADIRLDDPCTVRFQISQSGAPIALSIRDREPAAAVTPTAKGVISALSSTSVTLNTTEGAASFGISSETKFYVYGKSAGFGDLKTGMEAEITYRPIQGGAPSALRVSIPTPRAIGQISAVNGNVITVRDQSKNVTWTVTVPEGAKITSHGYVGGLSDLRLGYRVGVNGQFNGSSVVASAIEFTPIVHKGVVTAVDGDTITVATVQQTIITARISGGTVVLVRPRVGENRRGSIADIKVESPIDLGGHMSDGGPYQGGTMDVLWADVLVAQ